MSTALQKANILYELERFDETIELLNKASADSQTDVEIFVLMAWCYYRSQRASIGFIVASHALSLEPESIRALIIHSACASFIGKYKLATKSLDTVMALEPDNDFAHYHRAFQFVKRGKHHEALESINIAISIEPNSPVYLAFQSQIQLILGQNSEARKSALSALKLNPEAAYGHLQLGRLQRGEGNFKGSVDSLIEALRSNPNNRAARNELLETYRCNFPPYGWAKKMEFSLGQLPYWKRALFWISPILIVGIGILIYSLSLFNGLMFIGQVVLGVAISYGALFILIFALNHFSFVFLDGMVAFNSKASFALPQEQRLLSKISVAMLLSGTALAIAGALLHSVSLVALSAAILVCCFVIAYLYSLALH